MTFNPTSFFAGIGTVFVAIGVGFGGGLVMTNSVHKAEPPNRVERVAASTPLTVVGPGIGCACCGCGAGRNAGAGHCASTAASAGIDRACAGRGFAPTPAGYGGEAADRNNNDDDRRWSPALCSQTISDPLRPQTISGPRFVRSTARPQDQDNNDARRIAERKQAERRKWARHKMHQQELDAATAEVRRIDRGEASQQRGDASQEVVERDTIEMPRMGEVPRLGFFGQ